MIGLVGVSKRFGERVVFRDYSVSLEAGRVTAVLGANGSGKTTLGRLLLGLETPDAGAVTGVAGLRRAAVFQENRLCEQLTAVGNVRLVLPRSVSRSAVADELRAVGLDDESLAKPVRLLSGGQRRRVALVRGLVGHADLVVLDEPFTGLDTEARAVALAWVRERLAGRTALLITHDATEPAFFDADVVNLTAPPD